ncbi:MAG: hypothetical protein J5965_25585 [Aeriscardovia sp.]|nr:hypothetical protein [Aeriscardovia sp.]
MECQNKEIPPGHHNVNGSDSPKNESEQADLFAKMQAEIDDLRRKNDELCNMIQNSQEHKKERTVTKPSAPSSPRRRRAVAVDTPSISDEPTEIESDKSWVLKALGIAAVSVVALILIYNTGLLIPLALIGLGASGLLKAR